jgi:biopolymer transport protein ExbD
MKRNFQWQRTEQAEINVSPLIDMVFILLIFFIVSTSFVNEIGISSTYKDSNSLSSSNKPPLSFYLPGSGKVLNEGDWKV